MEDMKEHSTSRPTPPPPPASSDGLYTTEWGEGPLGHNDVPPSQVRGTVLNDGRVAEGKADIELCLTKASEDAGGGGDGDIILIFSELNYHEYLYVDIIVLGHGNDATAP